MNTLIITAHPHPDGFTHKIARAFKAGREAAGGTVDILDLYKTDLTQPFLTFSDDPKGFMPDTARIGVQKKIMDNEEIVFIHPLWWVGPPAILKNFLDNNLTSHFAYKMSAGKPEGLLKGKKTRLYITCDGGFWLYCIIGFPFLTTWIFGVLNYCGLSVQSVDVLYKKFKSTEDRQQKFLAGVEAQARRGGQTFLLKFVEAVYKIYVNI